MKIVPVSIVIPFKKQSDSELSLWMQIRKSNDGLSGTLEFPGGKVEANELPQEAAARELLEEVGVEAKFEDLELFKIHSHDYGDKIVKLYVYICRREDERFTKEGWRDFGRNWRRELEDKVPPANLRILEDLAKEFIK